MDDGPKSLDKKAVGARLGLFRERELLLTQAEMADKLGLAPRAYQAYERGANHIPNAVCVQLHQLFGLRVMWLLTGAGAPKSVLADDNVLYQSVIEAVQKSATKLGIVLSQDKVFHLAKILQKRMVLTTDVVSETEIDEIVGLAA